MKKLTLHKFPTQWNELNIRQQKRLAVLFHSGLKGLIFDEKVFFILMDIRWWQVMKYRKFFKIKKNVRFTDLKAHYKWLYNDIELTTFIPKIKKMYPPADRLTDFTVDEFAHTDDLALGWFRTKDREYLEYLTAVLYREHSNGKRIAFDKSELDERAKRFKKTKLNTLLAVALSYQGCKTHITKQFPIVFPIPKSSENKKQTTPKSSGFGKLILHFSGGKFGTHNETKATNIYTFLMEFSEQLKPKK